MCCLLEVGAQLALAYFIRADVIIYIASYGSLCLRRGSYGLRNATHNMSEYSIGGSTEVL
jgi:hypothetical protein